MPSFPKLFAFSVAWLVIAGSALIADTGDYDGIYRPVGPEFETWDCRSVGADGGALEIRGGQFRGVENLCQLTNPTDVNGMGATLYDAQCRSDGGQWHQRVMLMNAENGVYFLTDGFVAEWQSCENLGVQTASSGGVKQEPLVSGSVAAETIETDEGAPFDASAYDGTYIIELGRVWRDVYWTGQDNEFYVPGRVEPLSRAHVRADGGQLELIEAIEFQASDGPVFEAFVGRITESGAFNFWADVNYLVGRPKPYALRASIELGSGLEVGEALDAEPQGFNAAYDARVRLLRVSTKGSTAGRVEPSEAERLAAQQDARARLAAEQAERERLAAEQVKQERLAADQAERERVAAEQAERERLAAKHAERERLAAELAERERLAAKQAERERLAVEQAERERLAAELAARERLAVEQTERERLTAEQAESEQQFPQTSQGEGKTAKELIERHAERILDGQIHESFWYSVNADIGALAPTIIRNANRRGIVAQAISPCLQETRMANSRYDEFALSMFEAGYWDGEWNQNRLNGTKQNFDFETLMMMGLIEAMGCVAAG